jgi:tetratricopeptide (TPR) repeat protein
LDLDPFLWCSYEKLCKLNPNKIEVSKIYNENNLIINNFNKKYTGSNNSNIDNQQQQTNNNNNNNSLKGFTLSPNTYNENLQNFNSNNIMSENKPINTSHYGNKQHNLIKTTTMNNYQNNPDENDNPKIKTSLDYQQQYVSYNQNLTTMTPIINKGDQEYNNLNYIQPQVKNREYMKPFTYSSTSPNNIIMELNKHVDSYDGNNSNISNNVSSEVKNFNINISSNIKPFNINQSSGNLSNNNLNNNNITPKDFKLSYFTSNKTNTEENFNNKNMFSNIQLSQYNNNNNENNIFTDITQLLIYFAEILRNLSLYNCEETILLISKLPYNHQKSTYILSLLGRCYFELAKYKESERTYLECIKNDPSRLEGIEYFSSCLWHLKDQYQLCNLANHALEQSHFCAETWIIVGNCYSLQKEHEIALKYFNRAIQLNNTMSYAYTLCGHEYVDNESYILAKACFNQAINYDER